MIVTFLSAEASTLHWQTEQKKNQQPLLYCCSNLWTVSSSHFTVTNSQQCQQESPGTRQPQQLMFSRDNIPPAEGILFPLNHHQPAGIHLDPRNCGTDKSLWGCAVSVLLKYSLLKNLAKKCSDTSTSGCSIWVEKDQLKLFIKMLFLWRELWP